MRYNISVLLSVLLCFASFTCVSQSIPENPNQTDADGLRQGKWTLLFDANWKPTDETGKVAYYRLIEYKNDKPVGVVRDYYSTGIVQWEGKLLQDRPSEINEGEATWYHEDGSKDVVKYYEKGKILRETYYQNGKPATENADMLGRLAESAYYSGDYEKAVNLFEKSKTLAAKEFGTKHNSYAEILSNLGIVYNELGQYAKAEPLYIEALKIREKVVGKNHADYAVSLSNLGGLYANMGRFDEALLLYIEVKNIREKLYGKNHASTAIALNNLAGLYDNAGKYDLAEPLYVEARNIFEQVLGKEDENYAVVLNNLAVFYYRIGEYTKCEPLFVESKNIREKLLGKEHPAYAESLNNLASFYDETNNYQQSEKLYQEAASLYAKTLGVEHPNYASALSNLAEFYRNAGKYDRAESLHIQAKEIRKKALGAMHFDYALSVNNLAGLYYDKGFYEQAEPLYLESKEVVEQTLGKEHPQYAAVLNNLSNLYTATGNYNRAEELQLQAKDVRYAALGDKHPDYAITITNLADLYSFMGRYLLAEKNYQDAIGIYENSLGAKHPDYAVALSNLGVLYNVTGNYEKSIKLFIQSLEIQKHLGHDHPEYATSLANLANAMFKVGSYKKAEDLLIQAKGIYETSFGTENPRFATALNNLANVYGAEGRYDESERLNLQAMQVRGDNLGKDHPDYIASIYNMARLYTDAGRYVQAEQRYIEMCNLLVKQIHRYFLGLSESEKDQYYATVKTDFEHFNAFAFSDKSANLWEEAYDLQLSIKGVLLNDSDKIRKQILSSRNDSLISLYNSWRYLRNRLVKAYQMKDEERKARHMDIDSLTTQVNHTEKLLSKQSDVFRKSYDNNPHIWQDVQKKLGKNEAAVEIVRFRKYGIQKWLTDSSDVNLTQYPLYGLTDTVHYAALVITPTSIKPECIVWKNGNDLEGKLLKNYRNSIQFKLSDTISYNSFWKPIYTFLKKNKVRNVYFSPDGVYNAVNLNTLFNPESEKFVADEIKIQLVTNTKDLIAGNVQKNKKKFSNTSLFGSPDYSVEETIENNKGKNNDKTAIAIDTTQRFFDGSVISKLPGTEKEINDINSLLKIDGVETSLFLHRKATEEELKSSRSPQVLHIATHGFFLNDTDPDVEKGFAGFEAKTFIQNPLLRSGLLLTGAQQTVNGNRNPDAEDGIITAYEAMNLTLDDTDLVVLSACETGLGEIRNGEGVYGLQRAFQTAGAKSVLMSLWRVDDTTTQQLMTSFYANWIKSGNKREALKKAQDYVRKKYHHPYYWGAFILVGE